MCEILSQHISSFAALDMKVTLKLFPARPEPDPRPTAAQSLHSNMLPLARSMPTPSCLVIQGGTAPEPKSKGEIHWVGRVCLVWLRLCPEILQTGANAQRSWQGNYFTSGQNHKEITVEIHPKKAGIVSFALWWQSSSSAYD